MRCETSTPSLWAGGDGSSTLGQIETSRWVISSQKQQQGFEQQYSTVMYTHESQFVRLTPCTPWRWLAACLFPQEHNIMSWLTQYFHTVLKFLKSMQHTKVQVFWGDIFNPGFEFNANSHLCSYWSKKWNNYLWSHMVYLQHKMAQITFLNPTLWGNVFN